MDGETFYFNDDAPQTTPPTLVNLIYETTGPAIDDVNPTESIVTTFAPLELTTGSIFDELNTAPASTFPTLLDLETTEALVLTTDQSETTNSEIIMTTMESVPTTANVISDVQNTTLVEDTTQQIDLTTFGLDLTTMGVDLTTMGIDFSTIANSTDLQTTIGQILAETTQVSEEQATTVAMVPTTSTTTSTTTTSTTTTSTTTTTEETTEEPLPRKFPLEIISQQF